VQSSLTFKNALKQRFVKLRFSLLGIIIFICPLSAFAQNISILYDQQSPYQSKFFNALSTQLAEIKTIRLRVIPSHKLSKETLKKQRAEHLINLDNSSIGEIIALGIQTPTTHAMTTLASARHYAPCLPNCLNSLAQHRFFVLDQPAARQLQLIKLISSSFKNIGVIVTKRSQAHLAPLKQHAKKHQQTIMAFITDAENVRYQIDDISKTSDIILAIADTDIYNASSVSQILLTSYRHRTPIIGFSKGFIKAGALAGSVSSLKQLVQHLSEDIQATDELKAPLDGNITYPKYFSVMSNKNVANSLNINISSSNKLKQLLSAYESLQ